MPGNTISKSAAAFFLLNQDQKLLKAGMKFQYYKLNKRLDVTS